MYQRELDWEKESAEYKSEMFLSSECVRASRISLFSNPTRRDNVWCTLALPPVETEIARCGEAAGRSGGKLTQSDVVGVAHEKD